ncbi:MAG: GntR family transcriptional regulator [Egibacteraceae bacterium]
MSTIPPRARYQQIADQLREAIQRGDYAPGDPIPSETQLVEKYGLSRPTIRQAIAILRAEGLLRVEHGRGAFVRQRPPVRRTSRTRYQQSLRTQTLLTAGLTSEITQTTRAIPPVEVAVLLGIDEDAEAFARRRILRTPDGTAVEIATSWFPLQIVQAAPLLAETRPIPSALFAYVEEQTGRTYTTGTERIGARMPTPSEATALGLPVGIPVLTVVFAARDERDQPLEVVESVYPADRQQFEDTYPIGPGESGSRNR